MACRTSRCTEAIRSSCGQSSVEAALLLPVLMFCVAFLLQPALLLYTRSVMASAAAEVARAAATAPPGTGASAYQAMARRRLAAVPEVSILHAGGADDWQVEVTGLGEREVDVTIRGHVRPLPLMGVVAGAFGQVEGGNVVLEAHVAEQVRPSWLEGSYESWVSVWDG